MSAMNLEDFVKDVMLSIMRATIEAQKEAAKISCGCEINPEKHLNYSYGLSARAKESHAEIFRVDEAHFDVAVTPPEIKEDLLLRYIFPKHGKNGADFFGIESNPKTRAMYGRYGILSQSQSDLQKSVNIS